MDAKERSQETQGQRFQYLDWEKKGAFAVPSVMPAN